MKSKENNEKILMSFEEIQKDYCLKNPKVKQQNFEKFEELKK